MVGTAITSKVGDGISVLVAVGSGVIVGGMGDGVSVDGMDGTDEGILAGETGAEKIPQLNVTISIVNKKKTELIDFFTVFLLSSCAD